MSHDAPGHATAVPEGHFARLERVYHAAPTNGLIPAELTVSHGSASVRMPIADVHAQAVGEVHGFLYCKALDEVSFYAANSLVEDVFLTTASLNVQFLAPLARGPMLATAKVVHAGRSSFVVDAEARDEEGQLLARSTATFVRTKTALPPVTSR